MAYSAWHTQALAFTGVTLVLWTLLVPNILKPHRGPSVLWPVLLALPLHFDLQFPILVGR